MGSFFITDKGDIGYGFGSFLGIDSSGNTRIRMSDHVSLDTSTGNFGFNTSWKKEEKQSRGLIKCYDEEDEDWY